MFLLTLASLVIGSLALVGVIILCVVVVQLVNKSASAAGIDDPAGLSRQIVPDTERNSLAAPSSPVTPPSFSNASAPVVSGTNYTLNTVTVGDVERSYYISTSGPSKLLLWFHGTGSVTSAGTTFDSVLSEYQVIQPIGLTNADGLNSWQSVPGVACNSDADDIAFVNALLDMYSTDSVTQMYAGGFSVGSGFVARLSVDESMSSRFDGLMMCSSGIQASDLAMIEANGNTPNIFISNGDVDGISPVLGGAGTANVDNISCYDFAALDTVISTWATLACGTSAAVQTDSAGNQLYSNSCGTSRVYAAIFKDTPHAPASDSITSWIASMTGGSDKNLMTTALSILDQTLSI